MLLVDAGKQMFQGGGQQEDVPFALCLKVCSSSKCVYFDNSADIYN